jgi:uncharacterized protein YqcC (DUF446 family)
MSISLQVEQTLEQINQEMIRLDLWQSTMPSEEALQSNEPFCCDTLTFTQWLEFILLPKMGMLIASDLPLPDKLLILPMAQESFKQVDFDSERLLALIAKLDSLFAANN